MRGGRGGGTSSGLHAKLRNEIRSAHSRFKVRGYARCHPPENSANWATSHSVTVKPTVGTP